MYLFKVVISAWAVALAFCGSAYANSDCDGADRILRSNWTDNYNARNHPLLKKFYYIYIEEKYHSCDISYEDYYGLTPKAAPPVVKKIKPKQPSPDGGKTQSSGNLTDTANVDPDWAADTQKRLKHADETAELPEMETEAPRGNSKCISARPKPNRGVVDWDWALVKNNCSNPVGVLTCFHEPGRETDCYAGGNGSWGLMNIGPGEESLAISTTKTFPWKLKIFVCDMTPRPHSYMLCALPKSYRKG